MFTISSTTLTFESSTNPCTSVPRPSVPGTPLVGSPDAVVAENMFPPRACRPAGFWKSQISMVPTCCGAFWPGMATDTMPSRDTVTDVAFCGIVICGSSA